MTNEDKRHLRLVITTLEKMKPAKGVPAALLLLKDIDLEMDLQCPECGGTYLSFHSQTPEILNCLTKYGSVACGWSGPRKECGIE